MTTDFKYLKLETREIAADVAAQIIAAELDLAVAKYGVASLMVSGGSSPKPVYDQLSESDIGWKNIAIGLVDERWVKAGSAGSNADFIGAALLKGNAAQAGFLPMTTPHASAAEGLAEVHERYKALQHPFDVVVMGMGTDGHTASWFPESDGLSAALDMKAVGLVTAVNAKGCPGAGEFPDRITLTRAAIMSARNIILFITGDEKRTVFDASADALLEDSPIKALRDVGSRLTVIWAP